MNVIQSVTKITLNVKKEYLFKGKYISVAMLSEMLKCEEDKKNLKPKELRNKLYNSLHSNRYNVASFFGVDFVDVNKPLLKTASLDITFIKEE